MPFLCLLSLLLGGNRVKIDESQIRAQIHGIPLNLSQLSGWLAKKEDLEAPRLRDPQLAKQIIWANPTSPSQTEVSLLYLHGFSASNREMSPVVETLAQNLNANLYLPRLKGHGTTHPDDLAIPKPEEWLADAIESLEIARILGKKVFIVGTSFGGLLTTWLLNNPKYSETISRVALVSPMYRLSGLMPNLLNARGIYGLARFTIGGYNSLEPSTPEQVARLSEMKKVWTTPRPLQAIANSVALMNHVRQASGLKTPALFLYTPIDPIVNINAIKKAHSRWEGSEIIEVKAPDHVLAGELTSPDQTEEVIQILTRFFSKK